MLLPAEGAPGQFEDLTNAVTAQNLSLRSLQTKKRANIKKIYIIEELCLQLSCHINIFDYCQAVKLK